MSVSQLLPEVLAAKYREYLKPFEGHTQEILNSRIVDTNIDVANPPDGYYVRYENGVQECFRRWPAEQNITPTPRASAYYYVVPWLFPARFSRLDYVGGTAIVALESTYHMVSVGHSAMPTNENGRLLVWSTNEFNRIDILTAYARGTW